MNDGSAFPFVMQGDGIARTAQAWRRRPALGAGRRGIGSLYYLMYAIQHGLPEALALEPIQLTLIAVSLSILIQETAIAREVIQASVGDSKDINMA